MPDPPSPIDTPEQFNEKAFFFFAALAQFGAEASALAASIDFDSTDIQRQVAVRFAATGSGDAIVGVLAPAITAYTTGLRVTTIPAAANSGGVATLDVGAGAKKIYKRASPAAVAISAGDYNGSGPFSFEYVSSLDGGAGGWILLDPIDSVPPGKIEFYARATAPVGRLKANGAAVSRAVYSSLDAAIYVGDALNATSLSGYRCTDPANPSTSRSVTGAYIVLPDIRGEHLRGWDDGRGVDAGRMLLSWQDSENKSHAHQQTTNAYDYGSGNDGTYTSGNSRGGSYASGNYTLSAGGTETRVRTVAFLACITY
ncbi:hypothetical protein [Rhodocyclus tenuis]|uniref:Phage-related tail fiber protein n=1 Tax=Rhodocyclus tenuis TaxID=1066 RepID=A0A840GEQ8_RHOTE|nr:hypothetical protein [Rhodocyclus tenuis]MBB4249118.1 phage-related tail fiber protein [Rhodocyclus tenuis]